MATEFDEEIREFLIESNENLALLDQQIVQLEQQPKNTELISSVFRTIHSVKGTCGFFGFDILGAVTHVTESILGQLREQKRELTPELITLILEAVDAVKCLLARIESTGEEGEDLTEDLRERLEAAYRSCGMSNNIPDLLRDIQANEAVAETTTVEAAKPVLTVVSAAKVDVVAASPVIVPLAVEAPVAAVIEVAPLKVVPVSKAVVAEVVAKAPASGSTSATGSEGSGDGALSDSTIRVDVNLLNQLMNLVGELVLTRNQLLQSAGNFSSGVQQTSQRLNIITTELQASVMKTRMQPVGVVWSKLPRVVRDLSAKCGKQIDLQMSGAETELDKSLVEAIRDPLTHIVRNSCDHGIETPEVRLAKGKPAMGTLSLRAFHEAGAVNIEIVDDGAGIDPERVRAKAIEKKLITPERAASLSVSEVINLIFMPGFSTAAQVTSISGRGVGMDVVKTNIEKISGSVQIVCPPSGGTVLRIKIPLTLAIIPGLIVSCEVSGESGGKGVEERFVLPQSHLVEMTRVDISNGNRSVDKVNGTLIFRHRGNLLPLVYLSALLHKREPRVDEDFINIIILQVQGRQFGLVVDRICDTQEIVVKPLGRQLKHLSCYGGATIMGDGRPALILDIGGLAKLAELDRQQKDSVPNGHAARPAKVSSEFILFRVGAKGRMALPLSIVNRLEELPTDNIEYAAGQAVVRYRGELLPLVAASSLMTGEEGVKLVERANAGKTIHAVVINNGRLPFGLVVEEILDIVEESLSAVRGTTRAGLLGSAVIGGLVTDIVDATALCGLIGKSWQRADGQAAYTRRVAFFNPWKLGAEMISTLLEAAGYVPVALSSATDLRDGLSQGAIHAVLLDGNDTSPTPEWLLQAFRDGGQLCRVPRIQLTDGALLGGAGQDDAGLDGVESGGKESMRLHRVHRQNRPEVLGVLERLMPDEKEKAA